MVLLLAQCLLGLDQLFSGRCQHFYYLGNIGQVLIDLIQRSLPGISITSQWTELTSLIDSNLVRNWLRSYKQHGQCGCFGLMVKSILPESFISSD